MGKIFRYVYLSYNTYLYSRYNDNTFKVHYNLTLDVEPDKLKNLMKEVYIEALNTETTE